MDEVLSLQESRIYNFDKSSLFKSQIDWLNYLIDKARVNPDICFIIRVHPREFPNKRDGVKSKNAEKLEEIFNSLPSNVIINWPADDISLYELIGTVDLVLTFWSSAGLEASAFGCPIIIPENPICAYTAIADKCSETIEQYWNDILEGLNISWNINRVIKTFRWMWLNHFGGTISLESSKFRKSKVRRHLYNIRNWTLKKINRKNIAFLFDSSAAYHGNYRQISQRKYNVRGENLIKEQILNNKNTLDNFNYMHFPLSSDKAIKTAIINEEKAAIQDVLSIIFKTTKIPKKWVES
jgi:hypothetical protein